MVSLRHLLHRGQLRRLLPVPPGLLTHSSRGVSEPAFVHATIGFFTPTQLGSVSNLSQWAFLPAFAGVGLRTHLRDLTRHGWRPILVGVLGEIFIALLTLAMVLAVSHHHMH